MDEFLKCGQSDESYLLKCCELFNVLYEVVLTVQSVDVIGT